MARAPHSNVLSCTVRPPPGITPRTAAVPTCRRKGGWSTRPGPKNEDHPAEVMDIAVTAVIRSAVVLVEQQTTGEEPDRLTDQQELYENNEYKPHPVTGRQVEDVAVSRQTIRTTGPAGTGGVTTPDGVPAESLEALGDVLEDPFAAADED